MFLHSQLPDSKEYTLEFLGVAYEFVDQYLKIAPAFANAWRECLGDLARGFISMYRSVEELDAMKEWTDIARKWYLLVLDRDPDIGRLQCHFAVLSLPDKLQQLFHYTKSLVSIHPYPLAAESISSMVELFLRLGPYLQPVTVFIAAHGYLFKQYPICDLRVPVEGYLSQLR